jgi:hypothetical protein
MGISMTDVWLPLVNLNPLVNFFLGDTARESPAVVFIISIYKKGTAINPVQAAPREGKQKKRKENTIYLKRRLVVSTKRAH